MDQPKRYRLLQRIPLRMVLIALPVTLVVLTVALTGYLAYRNRRQSVENLSLRLRNEITSRIEEHVLPFLDTPLKINQLNAALLRRGILSLADVEALQRHFWEQVQIFDSVTSIYYGNSAGGLVNAGREGAQGDLYVIATDHGQSGTFKKFATDSQGRPTRQLASVPDFDARSRPWYIGAIAKQDTVWSPPYILFTGQDLAVACSLPVYDPQQAFLGVVSVDIFLSHLSHFMQRIDVGPTGVGYIIERSGLLVASSTDEKPFRMDDGQTGPQRLHAGRSVHPFVRRATETLSERFGDLKLISGVELLEYRLDGQRHFIKVAPVPDRHGLDWLIVVDTPEADFLSQFQAANRTTAWSIIGVVMVAIVIGIVAAGRINRPIRRLTQAAQTLSSEQKFPPIHPDDRIAEISDLMRSFNHMAGDLRQLVASLHAEIAERNRVEQSLRQSEERLDLVVKGAELGVWDWNIQSGAVIFNERWADMLGYTLSEIEPNVKSWQCLLHPDDAAKVNEALTDHLEGRTPIYQTEQRLRTRSGGWKWILDTGKVLSFDDQSRPSRALGIHQDITERKLSEETIRKSLREKEVLLKEIHHRVKNNLAVISSLLNLQAKRNADANVQKALLESQSRVTAMALIHETLYQTRDLSMIPLKEYTRKLVRDLRALYADGTERVAFDFDLDDVPLTVSQALACGLIINELVTNALKYAFPDHRRGTIRISAKMIGNDELALTIADDGIGLGTSLDWRQPQTLGLRLICLMAEQLRGSVEMSSSDGLKAVIRCKSNPDGMAENNLTS